MMFQDWELELVQLCLENWHASLPSKKERGCSQYFPLLDKLDLSLVNIILHGGRSSGYFKNVFSMQLL